MRARALLVASVIAVALAVAVPYAAAAAQPATPAPTPAVCPAPSQAPGAMVQLPVAPTPVPETTPICFVYGTCLACNHTTAQPCTVTQCGTRKIYHCGDCATDCVPPTI
jgi:hypothetical protein